MVAASAIGKVGSGILGTIKGWVTGKISPLASLALINGHYSIDGLRRLRERLRTRDRMKSGLTRAIGA